MASVINDPNGRKRIQFVAPDGTRKTIRLGRVDRKTAESICRQVEHLLSAQLSGQPIPRETAAWLGSIGEKLRQRLCRAGLIDDPLSGRSLTLKEFLEGYLAERTDLSPGTLQAMRLDADRLVAVLGKDTRLSAVTPADADRCKAYLLERKYARSTVARCLRHARHFFAVACRRKLIPENPFAHQKGIAVIGDPSRRKFIPAEEVVRVLEEIPDRELRAWVVLARWGGLRVPSEALALRWSDVLWDKNLLIIRSSKTARHASGGIRMVPLFPEVRTVLDELWQHTPEGEDRVLRKYRRGRVNPRPMFERYCERAGVQPWPKLFQNLRASRATELADLFPSHLCAAWLGHTEKVADAFYRQVREEHILRAVNLPNALASQATQKAAQHTAEQSGIACSAVTAAEENLRGLQHYAILCSNDHEYSYVSDGLRYYTCWPRMDVC